MKTVGRRLCCNARSHQMAKICSSLLVPLMIAVFTIVTTLLQMNLAKQQRDQDLQIAKDNREKDFEIANQTRILQNQIEEGRLDQERKIEDRRRAVEAKAQEDQQMNTVLAAYLKDMSEIMLSSNFTLANTLIATVVRAKTLTTIGW
jgi:glutathione S-transferase